MARVLVTGATGFIGSHLVRALLERGDDVRVTVRAASRDEALAGLDVKRVTADLGDRAALRRAARGVERVFHAAGTTNLRMGPDQLRRINVEGTRNVLEIAVEPAIAATLRRFVFTSSYATVGRKRGRTSTEADVIADVHDKRLTAYVRSRVQAENLVLQYARERGLPAVAMCVSTTYGAGDWGRTPHGAIIAGAAFGKLPFVMSGIELEAVGVDDAARAMILAADKGRVGERYLISDRMITNADVVRIAAEAAGMPAPTKSVPLPVSYAMAALGSAKGRFKGTDEQLSINSLRLMRAEAPVDCSKAKRELGWQPRPVEESIREAARFWVNLRNVRRESKTQA